MKTTLLATVAILGLAGGVTIAVQAEAKLPQLAASGQSQLQTNMPGMQLAQGYHPSGDTNRVGTQYSLSGKPELSTDAHASQLAESGTPEPQSGVHGTQHAASGLPQLATDQPSAA